jgi:hypothetical protein
MATASPAIELSPDQRSALSRALTRAFLGWFERMIASGQNPFAEIHAAIGDSSRKGVNLQEQRRQEQPEPGRP